MKKIQILIVVIILLSFAVSVYFYDQVPDKMASHWNAKGEVDGYMSKNWGLFLMPLISVVMFLMFIFIPKIDPLKKNIDKFRKYFDGFILFIVLFLFYLHLLTIFWSLDFKFSMTQMLIPAFGMLFYYCGVLIEKSKRNWFIGIRTPWTLSSDIVWDKTHRLGGKLFKITGIISLFGIVFQNYALFFVLIPVIIVSIYTMVYSYFEYKKYRKK